MYVRDVFAARYRWVVLAAGTLAQASFSASSVGLPALSPTLKSEYDLSLTQTGLALGIRQTAIPIGGALGAAVLPVLGSSGGTRNAFLFLAAACLTGAVIAAVFIRGASGGEPEVGDVTRPLHDPYMWRLGTGTGLFLLAQIGITGFVVLCLHEQRGLSKEAAGAVLAGIYVLAVAARIASGTVSDRLGSRLGPLRTIGVALALLTACVAATIDAPLALLIPLFL